MENFSHYAVLLYVCGKETKYLRLVLRYLTKLIYRERICIDKISLFGMYVKHRTRKYSRATAVVNCVYLWYDSEISNGVRIYKT